MPREEPFSVFMQRALFDPQCGYYSRKITTVGARGDFSTSASLSPLLGKAASRWIIEQSRLQPKARTVIEVGGGDGSLMKTVLHHLGWHRRWRFDFCMVERSAVLKEQQQSRLGGRARWFDDIGSALDSCAGRALIYQNEFLDALPITLVQWDAEAGCWMEVWLVHQSDGGITEALRPLSLTTSCAEDFSALAHRTPPPKQRCELHTGIKQWLADLSSHWRMGSMLAIDYGDTFPGIYHRRPGGTLRAYLLHQRLEGQAVYQNAGRQDITADVNFTDLRAWCARLGWADARMETQTEFIKRTLGRSLDKPAEAEDFLLAPDGAGSAFKCVTVRRQRP